MNGQRIGYVRVSALDQNPDRQLDQLPVDRTFTDRAPLRVIGAPVEMTRVCVEAQPTWSPGQIVALFPRHLVGHAANNW